MRDVDISKPWVELYKILKFEGLAASGGEAKLAIAEGRVRLNGRVETQKRKKVVDGDLIEFAGELLRICEPRGHDVLEPDGATPEE